MPISTSRFAQRAKKRVDSKKISQVDWSKPAHNKFIPLLWYSFPLDIYIFDLFFWFLVCYQNLSAEIFELSAFWTGFSYKKCKWHNYASAHSVPNDEKWKILSTVDKVRFFYFLFSFFFIYKLRDDRFVVQCSWKLNEEQQKRILFRRPSALHKLSHERGMQRT